MRIQQFQLIRYGKFTDRTIDLPAAGQDIHLIVGPNEAGKSTLRSAIADWLFGIPVRTPMAFAHAMPELRLGGTLHSEAAGERCFHRSKGRQSTLRAPDDSVLPDDALRPWLGGLDAASFTRMYALDHTTLVEGGAGILSASDDLGRLLFQSAAGIEHLGEVLSGLQAEAETLWAPRKAASRAYYAAQEQFDQASDALKKASLRTRDWKAQHDACQAAAQALQAARERHAQQREQLIRLERIRRVQPMLLALGQASTRLQALLADGDVPLLPEDAATALAEASQAAALAQADIQRLTQEIEQTRHTLGALSVDDALLALAPEITALNERRLQYRSHRQDIARRTEDIRQTWAQVAELAAGLGWDAQSEDRVRQRLPAPSVRTRLGRLLQQRGALAQQLRAAQAASEEGQQQLTRLRQSLAALPGDTFSPALSSAMEQAQQLGEQAAALDELHSRLALQAQALETALVALGPWRQDLAALQAMVPVPSGTLQTWWAEQQADALALRSLATEIDQKAGEHARVSLALDQLVRSFQPVSHEQVQAAREQRNAAWAAIRQAPQTVQDRASDFEQQMGHADALADARLQRMQHDADRLAQLQRLEQLALEQTVLGQRQQTVLARTREREQRWASLCASAGLPGLPLDMAERWLDARAQALQAAAEHAALKAQLQTREARLQAVHQHLWAQLKTQTGADAHAPAPPLADCLRQARACEAAAAQASAQRRLLTEQAQAAEQALGQLQASQTAATEAWDDWQRAWTDATQAAGYAPGVFADQVDAELQVLADIEERLERIRSHRTERIETMQADLQALALAVQDLCARAAPSLKGTAPDDAVLALDQRLAQARQAADARRQAQARLQAAELSLAQARQALDAARARVAPLLQAAGVGEWPALAQAIERSDQRRTLERDQARAQADLLQASDGLPLAQLQTEADNTDPAQLRLDLDRLLPEAEATVERIAALSAEHVTLQNAFDALNGSDQGALAEAQRQDALVRMAEAVESHLRLHTAARLLKWSMEQYRQTRQGPMLARASATFATLTGGSFSRLVVDAEGHTPRLYGVRPDGKPVEVSGMSEGSRDQLYLALRLAALELQIDQGRALPLIADDLFINFDDERTAAGLRVLGTLSRRMQVVFLTHHEHLVPLAREVLGSGLNVVRL